MNRRNQRDAGFTFIEVIVAMVIMMLGVIPLLGLFTSSMNNYNRSTKTTVALNLAEEKIEELGEMSLDTQVGVTPVWAGITGSPDYEYRSEVIDVSYDVDGKTVELYAIEVWVRWQVSSQVQEISLKNYSSGK